MKKKILIIIDTNIINTSSYDGLLGSMYYKIKEYIIDEELQDNIHIAIPQIVLDEITSHIRKKYHTSTKQINELHKNLKDCGENKITIKIDKTFDPSKKVQEHISEEEKHNSNIHVLRFSEDIKIPEDLYKDALKGRKIFNNHASKAFKDALIIELIMSSELIKEFDTIYILTENTKDFEPYIERLERKTKKIFKIQNNTDLLLHDFSDLFYLGIPKGLRKFVKNDYFKELIYSYYITSHYQSHTHNLTLEDLRLSVDWIQERAGMEDEDNYFTVKVDIEFANNKEPNKTVFVEIDESNNILDISDYDKA